MQDTNYLSSDLGRNQIFTLPSTVTNTQWHVWEKPRGVNSVRIYCIGGGGGGGGGFTAATSSARGGGGGGGGAGVSALVVAAMLLPDRLFVQVGAGGAGVGSGGGTAPSGIPSYVAVYPDTTANNVLLAAMGGIGGGTGTGAAIGAAAGAAAAAGISQMPLGALGIYSLQPGVTGYAGGAIAGGNGTNSVLLAGSGQPIMGGAGGAGTTSGNFAGGYPTPATPSLISNCASSAPAAGSFNGAGGYAIWPPASPFFSYSGCGGSSSNTSVGGNGGIGGPGSGGGGGGGGTTGGTGGTGGNGIVIITAW